MGKVEIQFPRKEKADAVSSSKIKQYKHRFDIYNQFFKPVGITPESIKYQLKFKIIELPLVQRVLDKMNICKKEIFDMYSLSVFIELYIIEEDYSSCIPMPRTESDTISPV